MRETYSDYMNACNMYKSLLDTSNSSLENISDFFFKIISGVITIQDISGDISFNDLKKAFE